MFNTLCCLCLSLIMMPMSGFSQKHRRSPTQTDHHANVSLVLTGDIDLAGPVRYYVEHGYYHYNDTLVKVAPYLREADVAIGNLESSFLRESNNSPDNRRKAGWEVVLNARIDAAPTLKFAGYDILSVANNHLNDFGDKTLNFTVSLLKGLGIGTLGYNYGQGDAPQIPVIKVVRGVKIGFLSYCHPTAVCHVKRRRRFNSGPAVLHNMSLATRDVRALKQKFKPDVIVVFLHWGKEYQPLAVTQQVTTARHLTSLGVDVIVGSHSHVLQKHCYHGNTLVAYGLGNFLFPPYPANGNDKTFMRENSQETGKKAMKRIKWFEKAARSINNPTSKSHILRVQVNKKGVVGAEYLPVQIHFDPKTKRLQPTPVSSDHWIEVCGKEDENCGKKGEKCI